MLLMYCGSKKLKGRENEEEIDGRGNELVEGAVLVDIVVREEVLPEGEVVLLDVLLGEVVLLEVMVGVVVVGEVVLLDGVVREGILLNVELEEKVMLLLLLGEGSIFVGEMELAALFGFWMLETLRAKMAWLIAAIALS